MPKKNRPKELASSRQAAPETADAPLLCHSIARASKITGLSRSTLYKLIAARDLASIKLAKRRLIADADLRALLERFRDGGVAR